jgi:N-alpha-acetyl-L-2,4-diaminobutyrate deacetylase
MAGNHGDEYPGQVAILKLWRELEPEYVTGRLILIPCLNPPAAKAATRLSPLDGRNFNRCFPGNPSGTPSEMLAHYLSSILFPMADIVMDLHSGGRSANFLPCAHMHLVPDLNQRQSMILATEAFLTNYTFLYTDVAGSGLLPSEAERQGKIVITTELGGGEPVLAGIHRICQRGLRNVLIHCKAGLHRTGCMLAIYRMEYEGWTKRQAVQEMKDNGFGESACTSDNDYVMQYVLSYKPGVRQAAAK